ncbi:hypothetical protein BJV74DRAFT_16876 [Russula compacta]|nr:hypothetical protein BJV74DRAFT_16876 [Russula compacta]
MLLVNCTRICTVVVVLAGVLYADSLHAIFNQVALLSQTFLHPHDPDRNELVSSLGVSPHGNDEDDCPISGSLAHDEKGGMGHISFDYWSGAEDLECR